MLPSRVVVARLIMADALTESADSVTMSLLVAILRIGLIFVDGSNRMTPLIRKGGLLFAGALVIAAAQNVVVANGETLMIGGLILEDTSDSFGRVPFLSKVPLIKSFFTMKTNSDQQRELLIFITPSIIG